jgi:hypothetical protein
VLKAQHQSRQLISPPPPRLSSPSVTHPIDVLCVCGRLNHSYSLTKYVPRSLSCLPLPLPPPSPLPLPDWILTRIRRPTAFPLCAFHCGRVRLVQIGIVSRSG